MKGEHPDLKRSDIKSIDSSGAAQALKMRAQRPFDKLPLLDHPSWDCLKSRIEIDGEFKEAYPRMKEGQIRKMTDSYINNFPGIIKLPIPNIDHFDHVTGD